MTDDLPHDDRGEDSRATDDSGDVPGVADSSSDVPRAADGSRRAPRVADGSGDGSRENGSSRDADDYRLASVRTAAEKPAALYDRWAPGYDVLARWTPGLRRLRQRAVDALKLDRGDAVLEVGCGTGANLPLLARQVGPRGRVIGLDLAPGSVTRARERTRAYPQVDVLRADATRPPIGEVDAVLATFVVGMLDDPSGAVDAWCDLVDGDGHVVLFHLQRSHGLAAPLLNAGLDVVARLSTPPTLKLRYDEPPTRILDRRVREAHDALRVRADASVTETRVFGLAELAGGQFDGGELDAEAFE